MLIPFNSNIFFYPTGGTSAGKTSVGKILSQIPGQYFFLPAILKIVEFLSTQRLQLMDKILSKISGASRQSI